MNKVESQDNIRQNDIKNYQTDVKLNNGKIENGSLNLNDT